MHSKKREEIGEMKGNQSGEKTWMRVKNGRQQQPCMHWLTLLNVRLVVFWSSMQMSYLGFSVTFFSKMLMIYMLPEVGQSHRV